MIDSAVKNGAHDFVVSSSGNAALAAALYIKKYNQKNKKQPISLQILVGKNINPEKLKSLKKIVAKNILLAQVNNPKQAAFQLEKKRGAHWLRQSTDPTALIGYESLAKELLRVKKIQAVFIPTSSGTTAEGLYLGFKNLKLKPQIHIIQTTACHPFVKTTEPNTETSLANAIVDIVGRRQKEIQEIIKTTKGGGWVANDEEIVSAVKLIKKTTGLKISSNSALSLVGLQKVKQTLSNDGAIILLITGN